MKRCQRKRQRKVALDKEPDLVYAIRSFMGYLEGTEKAAHTIKNYRCDLTSFQEFLEKGLGSKPVALSEINRKDLEKYHEYLKTLGLKTNSRRRKILTVRRLLRYLTQRKKLAMDVGHKLPAPHKIERIPLIVSTDALIQAIQALPSDTEILARNRVLLWCLAEVGCQVSELSRLRFDNWSAESPQTARVSIVGKNARVLPVSRNLYDEVCALKSQAKGESPWLFLGFNKFGSLGSPITPRGVELLVKAYAERLGLGDLTPRTFRHSAVLRWHQQGLGKDEIQKRLGLRTLYAFRVYEPVFKSNSGTTSTSTTAPNAP